MRPRVPWMNELDDTILEFLAELDHPAGEPVVINPQSIYENIVSIRNMSNKTAKTISRRMNTLYEHGLLDMAESSGKQYFITEKGLQYLSGEVDADELKDNFEE